MIKFFTFRRIIIFSLFTTVIFTVIFVAFHNPPVSTDLSNDFICNEEASPEKLVVMLQKRGVIEDKPYIVGDSLHSYASEPGYSFLSFPFIALVAWDDTNFFSRGPGTSPGSQFSFVVQANQLQLEKAAQKYGINIQVDSLFEYPEIYVSVHDTDLPKRAETRLEYAAITCRPYP